MKNSSSFSSNNNTASTPSKASRQSTSVELKDKNIKISKSSVSDKYNMSSVSEFSSSPSGSSFKTKNSNKPMKTDPTKQKNRFSKSYQNDAVPDRCSSHPGIKKPMTDTNQSLSKDGNLASKIASFSTSSADPSVRMHFTIVCGMVVDIVGGKHKGKTATFVKRTTERIQVIVEDMQSPVYLNAENIKFRNQLRTSNETNRSEMFETISDFPKGQSFPPKPQTPTLASRTVALSTPPTGIYNVRTNVMMLTGVVVNIIGGKHKGASGTFIRQTEKRVWVIVEGSHNPVMLLPENIEYQQPKNKIEDIFNPDLEFQTVINRCFLDAKEEKPMLNGSRFMKTSTRGIRV